ncbi:MAG: hypothetical protein WAZ99_10705 [Rectinemataceae bacterium]
MSGPEPGFAHVASAGGRPFPRSYPVMPGLYAGEWPGDGDRGRAAEKLSGLLRCGVDRIIRLTEDRETGLRPGQKPPYDKALAALAATQGRRVRIESQPIPDYGVPDAPTMRAIVKIVRAALDTGETVFIHCWGGRGRTGTVVACLLREFRGLSGDEALAELVRLRADTPDAAAPSPETEEQREFVRNWENAPG